MFFRGPLYDFFLQRMNFFVLHHALPDDLWSTPNSFIEYLSYYIEISRQCDIYIMFHINPRCNAW